MQGLLNNDLKPEHIKAFRKLHSFLSESGNVAVERNLVPTTALVEGSVQLFAHNLTARRIPSGSEWRWNQAKGKKEVYLRDHDATVTLTKLIPRRRQSTSTDVPRYKLWHFAVRSQRGDAFTVLWCEKGCQVPPKPLQTCNASATPAGSLHKAQLSFICN